MQYGDLITRSLSIVWRHRYLWVLAILGGADVGSVGFNADYDRVNPAIGNATGGGSVADAGQRVVLFLQDNLGVVVAVAAAVLLLAVAWLLLSSVTTGALVRASAEHDADRPFHFGPAWRAGLASFWSVLGLKLMGLLFGFALVVAIGVLVLLGVLSFGAGAGGALAVVVIVGVLLVVALIPFGILLGILFMLATRTVVLEQQGAGEALSRSLLLMRRRFGRTLLVWLVQVGLSLGVGLAAVLVLGLLLVVLAAPTVAAAATGGLAGALLVGIPALLLMLAAALLVGGLTGAYFSTYWTLAFRRLDLDRPPQPAWRSPSYTPQPPTGYPAPRPQ
jgi:hypothetical protein